MKSEHFNHNTHFMQKYSFLLEKTLSCQKSYIHLTQVHPSNKSDKMISCQLAQHSKLNNATSELNSDFFNLVLMSWVSKFWGINSFWNT